MSIQLKPNQQRKTLNPFDLANLTPSHSHTTTTRMQPRMQITPKQIQKKLKVQNTNSHQTAHRKTKSHRQS